MGTGPAGVDGTQRFQIGLPIKKLIKKIGPSGGFSAVNLCLLENEQTKTTFSTFRKFCEPQKVQGLVYRNLFWQQSQLVVCPPMSQTNYRIYLKPV